MIFLLSWYVRHQFLGMTAEDLHNKVFDRLFRGNSFHFYSGYIQSFLDEFFESLLSPSIVARLLEAQKKGHYTVILSNSPSIIVEPVAKRFGVDSWKGTSYIYDENGFFSHIADYLDGAEKAAYTLKLAEQLNIEREKITAFSDSYHDIPLLSSVGKAVAVNPDRSLKLLSQNKNWEIVND
jgi:HAD superfamily phosphoserine phosphatase-like hydrolase